MVRQTSLLAYNTMKESGVMGKLQWEVYDFIYNHGPLTQSEIHELGFVQNYRMDSIKPRCTELKLMGLIKESLQLVRCGVTGSMALQWDVTNKVLTTRPKKTTEQKLDIISKKIEKLQIKKRELETELIEKKD